MEHEPYISGMVVSAEPLVTYSKRSTGYPLGLVSARPEAFAGRRAIHFIGFSHNIESEEACAAVAADMREAAARFPESRIVCLTNSETEALLLSRLAVASVPCSQAIFLNDKVFRPLDVPPHFDAIYNARLIPVKRHGLARDIESLGLIYDIGPPDEPILVDETRALLPRAVFVNHEAGGGAYRQFSIEECAVEVNRGRVGLCLSAAEGVMQAAIEYLLCGLAVVSTRSIGGRDRYLLPPFCRIVADEPRAIAAAVAQLAERRFPKAAVRAYAMHAIGFDRHNFLIATNALARELFGMPKLFASFEPFAIGLTRWRTVEAAMAPLEKRR